MASMELAESVPAPQVEDNTVVKLFCSAFGAVLAVLGDLMNNERASLLIKLREVLKTYASPQFEDTFAVMLFVVAISLCLFVVRPPKGRGEAFAQGLAVFAVFTTLAPYKPVPLTTEVKLSALAPAPSLSSLLISPAEAAMPGESVYARTVTVWFDDNAAPAPGARVIIRSAANGMPVGQKFLTEGRSDVTITAPVGAYDLDVEAAGYERTRARITIVGGNSGPAVIRVPRSSVPLPIQQLYAPSKTRGIF